jgi:homogentisate 1,2-dioxygenase
MRMRHLKTQPMSAEGDPVTGRRSSSATPTSRWRSASRRADGLPLQERAGRRVLFVHYGSGTLYTMFGARSSSAQGLHRHPQGDHLQVVFDELADADRPEGVTKESMPYGKFVLFETMQHEPHRAPAALHLQDDRQFLEHAPYCERDLRRPRDAPLTFDEKGEFEVRIKARDRVHSLHLPLPPARRRRLGRVLLPLLLQHRRLRPDHRQAAHAAPDPPDVRGAQLRHLLVLPADARLPPRGDPRPYNHSNLDSDEVLYYVEGNYKARRGIEIGSISLHPQGIPHGPHPGTVEASLGQDRHRTSSR